MQLLPETARLMGVTDNFDPRQNIMGGARYLQVLARRFCRTPAAAPAAARRAPGARAADRLLARREGEGDRRLPRRSGRGREVRRHAALRDDAGLRGHGAAPLRAVPAGRAGTRRRDRPDVRGDGAGAATERGPRRAPRERGRAGGGAQASARPRQAILRALADAPKDVQALNLLALVRYKLGRLVGRARDLPRDRGRGAAGRERAPQPRAGRAQARAPRRGAARARDGGAPRAGRRAGLELPRLRLREEGRGRRGRGRLPARQAGRARGRARARGDGAPPADAVVPLRSRARALQRRSDGGRARDGRSPSRGDARPSTRRPSASRGGAWAGRAGAAAAAARPSRRSAVAAAGRQRARLRSSPPS